jgi:invasion protein IalB
MTLRLSHARHTPHVIAAALALLLTAPAAAQDAEATPPAADEATPAGADTAAASTREISPRVLANGTRFDRWTLACEALAVDRTLCVLTQRLASPGGDTLLAELVAFWDGAASTRYLSARVPEGVYLPSGFALQPDDGEQIDFVWQACADGFCEALIELTDERVAEIDGADAVLAGYRPALGADPVAFRFSAEGLDEGLAALKAARREAQD